jgi:hypothetical protein
MKASNASSAAALVFGHPDFLQRAFGLILVTMSVIAAQVSTLLPDRTVPGGPVHRRRSTAITNR